MRVILSVILFVSVAWIGVQQAFEYKRRQMLLLSVADSLAVLQSEICVQRTPLSRALFRCSETNDQTKPFYMALLHGAETDLSFKDCWRSAVVQMLPMTGESRHALLALGEQIGQYDLQAQETAFEVCIAAFREQASKMSVKTKENVKLSVELGTAFGLLLAIACY